MLARKRPTKEAFGRGRWCRMVGLCVGWLLAGSALASDPGLWQEDVQRLRVGLRLFPAVLGAVEALEERRGDDGTLRILVVHDGGDAAAAVVVRTLNGIGEVRGLPITASPLSMSALDRHRATPIGGVFVASVGIGGARLRAWSERLQTLVFSPFSGDLEAGAVAGLYVADRVLPQVNLPQAQRAGIRFKPFFLKVARQHE